MNKRNNIKTINTMEGILVRIKIRHVKGSDIGYFHEKEILEQLELTPSKFDPTETYFNVGDTFFYGEKKYKVVEINTKFFNKTHQPHDKGINLYRTGDMLPFNFQITYVVETVE